MLTNIVIIVLSGASMTCAHHENAMSTAMRIFPMAMLMALS
jgi:hypothetical protein